MKPLNEIFTFRYFKHRKGLSWRTAIICSAIAEVFKPATVVDVGCSIGDFVNAFLDLGIDAYGIDGATACFDYLCIPKELVTLADLREPQDWQREYDLALCFEVAEHIEKESADTFLSNLTALADHIIFTAARPGWAGHHHVNLQRNYYWIEKFEKLGYIQDYSTEDLLRSFWFEWRTEPGIKAIYENLIYVSKTNLE
jgi:hypothetical protein